MVHGWSSLDCITEKYFEDNYEESTNKPPAAQIDRIGTKLRQNCSAYHDIQIDADALSQLPKDGNVLGDILTKDDDSDGKIW